MFVKPNPNKKVGGAPLEVYDPAHRNFLPEEGREVPNNAYWIRRLQTEDVVKATPGEKATAKAPAKTAGATTAPAKTKTTKAKKASKTKGE